MQIRLREIFWIFFKIGAVLLGGGFVILPMLLSELVEKRHWLEKDELVEYYSLSQCLPGIIAVNTSIFTGYKLKGLTGAITAAAGICFSPVITIICLASILNMLTGLTFIKSIFWGVGIGLIVLIILTVKEIWEQSIVDNFTLLLFIMIILLAIFTSLSPIILITISILFGILHKLNQRRCCQK